MTSTVLVTGGTGHLDDSGCRLVDADWRGACARPPPARHAAPGHVLHRRSPAGRRHRSGREQRRGDHPLRDQHEGRRGRDQESGDGGDPDRLSALRAAVHRWHRPDRVMGIREGQARGRADRGQRRPTRGRSFGSRSSTTIASTIPGNYRNSQWCHRCRLAFVSSRSIPARSRPVSSSSPSVSPPAAPRTWPDRKYRVGWTCSGLP